mgnify:CR=1 FL=1
MKQKLYFFYSIFPLFFTTVTMAQTCGEFVKISASQSYSLGIKSDGTLWAWGANFNGQLGLGDNTDRNAPVQVGAATNWVDVSAGMDHSLGIKSDGTL